MFYAILQSCVFHKRKKYNEISNNKKKYSDDYTNLPKAAIANTSLCDVVDDILGVVHSSFKTKTCCMHVLIFPYLDQVDCSDFSRGNMKEPF